MKNKENFLLRDIISDESKTDNEEKDNNKKKKKSTKRKKSNVTASFLKDKKNQTERQDISERKNLIDNQNPYSEIEDKKKFKHSKSKSYSISSGSKNSSKPSSETVNYSNQKSPKNKRNSKVSSQINKSFEAISERKEDDESLVFNKLNGKKNINDDYDKNEYFLKIQIFDFYTLYFTLITFISGILYHIITYFPQKEGIYSKDTKLYNLSRNFCLIICAVSSFFFILSSINKYHIYLLFDRSTGNVEQKVSFFSFDYFGIFMIESLLALLHPNILVKNKYFKTSKTLYRTETRYQVNDILLLICLLRVYIIIRYYISSSQFNTPRSQRIARLIGGTLNRLFVVKCLIIKNPFSFLIVIAFSIILVGSYMLRIAESPAYEAPENEGEYNDNDYRKFENCLWNVMITMTTVGYGDYYPITLIGRLVNVFLSIAGTLLTSYMVVFLQNELVFTDNEDMAFNYREKSVLKEKFEQKAANYYSAGFKYIIAKKRYIKACKLHIPKRGINQLKAKMTESLYDKIKAKRAFKKVFQNYQNIYEAWDDEDILKQKMDDFQDRLSTMNNNCDQMREYIDEINKMLDQIQNIQDKSEKKDENESDIIDTSKKSSLVH